jgi:hypothetical protein
MNMREKMGLMNLFDENILVLNLSIKPFDIWTELYGEILFLMELLTWIFLLSASQ